MLTGTKAVALCISAAVLRIVYYMKYVRIIHRQDTYIENFMYVFCYIRSINRSRLVYYVRTYVNRLCSYSYE